MGVFGNINGVFSGLGKPYIKLEFDDNTALLDFQKRMNESGEAQEAEFEDGEFKPIEGVKMLSEKDFYNLIEREPKYINLDSEKYNYTNNKIKPITDSNGIIKNAYSFRTPIDEIFCWTDFFHIVSGNSSHQDRTRILPLIKPTLEDPNCIFENGKENYFIKPFITEKGVKIIFAFIPTLKENSRVKTLFERPKKEIYNLYTKGGGNLYQKFDILDGSTTLNGVANQSKPFKVVEFRLPCKVDYYFSDNQIFNKNLGALNGYGDKYTVIDNRKRAKKEPGELVANKNLVFTKEDSNSITNYNHTVINNPDYKEITILFQSQHYETHFPFFYVTKKARKETHSTQTGKDGQLYDGHIVYIKVPVEVEKLYNFDRNSHTAYISLSYYKDLKNKAFKQFLQSWQNTFNNYKEQIKKIKANTYLNSSTKESWIKEQKEYLNDALKAYKYNCDFYGIENDSEKDLYEDFDEENLGAAGDFYTVLDVRTRARKEPGELTANKNLKFQKTDSIKNFDVKLFNKDFDKKTDIYEYSTKTINNVKYIELDAKKKHDEKLYTNITVWQPISFNKKENSFICTYYNYDIEIDSKKAKNIKKIGDRYSLFITETYYNQLCNEAVNKDIANLKRYANKENERILKNYSILYKNPRAYNIYMRMFEKSEPRKMIEKNIKDIERVSINGLGAPGDVYLVTDTRKNPRKELDETAAFKKIDIEKFNVNALKALQDSDPILYEEIKAGIGKTANNLLYNDNSIIDCRGFQPTYKILSTYDSFFDVAKNKNTFAGFGLDDTKKLIADTCRKHYKDCEKIAKHLKGDCLIQSAFNLWHWLRHNIRYEYDREGREEVRAPLRTWQDRERGVDCDCLSVFAWCVLKCMGYNPAFELAAFKNRENFSHIYINCDGIIVDRVWFIFNSRPPLVTKTEIYKVNLQDLGKLF